MGESVDAGGAVALLRFRGRRVTTLPQGRSRAASAAAPPRRCSVLTATSERRSSSCASAACGGRAGAPRRYAAAVGAGAGCCLVGGGVVFAAASSSACCFALRRTLLSASLPGDFARVKRRLQRCRLNHRPKQAGVVEARAGVDGEVSWHLLGVLLLAGGRALAVGCQSVRGVRHSAKSTAAI